MMFFLSRGAVPIYDRFAHAAVKALLFDKSPIEVFVPGAPSKNAIKHGEGNYGNFVYYSAVNVMEEYMRMLSKVFPSEIHKGDDIMYIPRELDQALWVYGHAYLKYPDGD